jgi:hypothetical protein
MSKTSRVTDASAAVGVLFVLAGCSTSTSPPEPVVDAGAPDGGACITTSDCAGGLLCGYPIAQGCSAQGVCVPEDIRCTNDGPVVCGCDGSPVGLACIWGPDYAAAPVVSATPGCQPDLDAFPAE